MIKCWYNAIIRDILQQYKDVDCASNLSQFGKVKQSLVHCIKQKSNPNDNINYRGGNIVLNYYHWFSFVNYLQMNTIKSIW